MGKNLNASRLIDGLYVDASGNVGVNTTSPSYKFDVSGTFRATGTITAGGVIYLQNSGTTYFQQYIGGGGDLVFYNTTNNGIYMYTNSVARFSILGNGNVGIGTSSPSVLFEAYKTGGSAVIRANYNGTTTFDLTASSGGNAYLSTSNNAMIFETNYTERMRILSGGGVRLQDATELQWKDGNVAIGGGGAANIMYFNTNSTERVRITSGGNVLIGTTSDNGTKLQISGGANISGGVSIGSSITTHSGTLANVSGSAQFLFAFDTSRTRAGIFTAYSPNGSGNYYMTCQIDNRGGAMTAQTILGNAINITFSGNNVYITTSNSQTVNTWYWTFLYLN